MSLPKGTTVRSGYNPLQPRVPKGHGDDSGEWTEAANGSSGTASDVTEAHQRRVARFKQLRQLRPGDSSAGYYNYGTPIEGEAQWALPEAIEVIEDVAKRWRDETGKPPFGVGNISLKTGKPYDRHKEHGDGVGIDIRPVRKDGKQVGGTNYDTNPAYDREATQRLVYMFLKTGRVEKICFNDPKVKGVERCRDHDDHLHVRIKLP
ncbi:MAG: hypothetical protein K1X51_05025 [Rhodospirillaceae bacterium]|nr:hypothetical protein [Rhodospirillaceae bacterium]